MNAPDVGLQILTWVVRVVLVIVLANLVAGVVMLTIHKLRDRAEARRAHVAEFYSDFEAFAYIVAPLRRDPRFAVPSTPHPKESK